MRYISRSTAFALCLSLGTVAWYVLAFSSVTADAPVQSNIAPATRMKTPTPPRLQPTPSELIRFGPVKGLTGYTNTETVILRQKPDASAAVVARVKMPEQTSVEILGATRDFIHVKFPALPGSEDAEEKRAENEGWATWGAIIPDMTAIVLDADTGAVVSRVPLRGSYTRVAYSPDSSRALFYRTDGFGGPLYASDTSTDDQEESVLAYEATTDDYKLTRSVVSSDSHLLGPLFYSPVDGMPAMFGRTSVDEQTKLSLMRLGDFYTVETPTEISAAATGFSISPDGLTGFISHPPNADERVPVDVFDLRSLMIRNKLSFSATQFAYTNTLVVNRDGSEIYLQSPESKTIQVIDTWTGETVRELPTRRADNTLVSLSQESLVGDSLLISYWKENDDGMSSRAQIAWLGSAGRIVAEREIGSAVEANGLRYAVNSEGTRLFRLDKNYHIQDRLPIERPEIQQRKDLAEALITLGLSASPDGRQIIVFVGMYEGC